jgi:hypothetical protein
MSDEQPAWLKRMDNGAIGEARTKAFLIDRFWILDRSVDIDGADLIIQRKITAVNLLDPKPPRFGVIQVKFFNNIATTQYIHKEYLIDKSGMPRDEFFLVCHTGFEGETAQYLVSAKEIVETFDVAKAGHTHEGKFVIPGRMILQTDTFKVVSPRHALDRIERAIEKADFERNRFFISWALPSVNADFKKIDPIYLEPIENWWGHIPTEFVKMKRKAQKALYEIEDVYDLYKKIVESSDPEEALSIAEEIEHEHKAGGRVYLTLPDDLYDEDFVSAVKEHKEKYAKLKSAGILDSFLILHENIISYIAADLGPHMVLDKNTRYEVYIAYDSKNLRQERISTSIVYKSSIPSTPDTLMLEDTTTRPSISGIIESNAGSIRAFVMPGSYCYDYSKKAEQTWLEYFQNNPLSIISEIMDKIYNLHFAL